MKKWWQKRKEKCEIVEMNVKEDANKICWRKKELNHMNDWKRFLFKRLRKKLCRIRNKERKFYKSMKKILN